MTFLLTITNGNFTFQNRERFLSETKKLNGIFAMKISRWKQPRSMNQNKYYWGVVIEGLAQHLGYESEELHDALRQKFLRVQSLDHRLPPHAKSTTDLNTKEFEEYVDKIRRFADVELNYFIPLPNEVEYES